MKSSPKVAMLSNQVEQVTTKALQEGHLIFTKTTSKLINDTLDFEVKLAPSLVAKPPGQLGTKLKATFNPFLPPQPGLIIKEYESYNLVLNKYCVTLGHLILAPSTFESQYTALCRRDFDQVFSVLDELQGNYLCFYNCGQHSGASILHKHIQMIPYETLPIDPVIQEQHRFDFLYFMTREKGWVSRFDQYLHAVLSKVGPCPDNFLTSLDSEPPNFISYNILFTRDWLMIIPRKIDSWEGISVNSLGFAGMLLAKSPDLFSKIQQLGPMNILSHVTF